MNDKETLRKTYSDVRKRFNRSIKVNADEAITKRLLSNEAFEMAECVMVYADFGSEVSTRDIIQGALKMNKKVCLPVCDSEQVLMTPYRIKSTRDLILGTHGIYEPNKKKCDIVKVNNIDFVLVPGLAFDVHGYRLGYGKGYYDRFLPQLKADAIIAGLAYEFQIANYLPHETHDVNVGRIYTDERVIICK